jgi:hypothetical protein
MFPLLLQILGLVLLIAGLVVGYAVWVRPRESRTSLAGRGLLLLLVLTLMGGLIGSPFWWADLEQSFAWDTPPLASRMLASAGWAFAVTCFLALQRPVRRRLRLVLILLFVYLFPLALAILLFHLERFDPAAPITYAFFLIVITMVVTTGIYLYRQPGILPDDAAGDEPTRPAARAWLAGTAAASGLWGLALMITDQGPSPLIWVWPGDLLSSRLIGVMLLAIAAGALYSRRWADPARVMLAVLLVYGLGLAFASLWSAFTGQPVRPAYLAAFAIVGLGSAALLLFDRPRQAQTPVIERVE